ncbi:MAG: acetylxylan esterase [Acidobacteriota bacterium]
MKLFALAGLVLAPLLCAQTAPPAPDPFLLWLDGIAQKQLDQREQAIAAIRDRYAAEQRKSFVRAKLMEILGGLPDYTGPLNARRTGKIAADGYVIEKVIFESLRGFYVTGNVYRPVQPGRYPGVLIPIGHTQEGKPEGQVLAANLAKKGFVAFAFDPIGQGEREQDYIEQLGRPLSGGAGNEHLELGARSLLLGQSVARYFIHDARRSLDYLISRPDVDPDRLGVTGCSGGGCITTYLAALDPRIKAAAPACYIQTFRKLFTGPTADSEMSLPAFLANGLDIADFVELPSPLPWLLLATTEDYFTPDGARPVYEEARRWYRLYDAEDRVQFFVGNGPHGTPKESREAIYAWMIRWLKDGRGDATDQPVKQYTNIELRVTSTGHVSNEQGSRALHQIIREEMPARRDPRTVEELEAELVRLGVPSKGTAPDVQLGEESRGQGFRVQQVSFEVEPGVPIAAKLYLPNGGGRKKAVVVVEDKRLPVPLHVTRSQSTAAISEAFVRAGSIVLELEPRDSPAANDGRPFLGNWTTNERVDLIGRNLAAMRAHDILRGVDLLASRPDVDAASIRGYARGVKGVWMLLAAAADPRLTRLWLDRTPASLLMLYDGAMTNNLFDAMIPGFARHWDFADLQKAMNPRPVLWTDPTNWMNRVVDAGPAFRYRYVGEPDAAYVEEFLR